MSHGSGGWSAEVLPEDLTAGRSAGCGVEQVALGRIPGSLLESWARQLDLPIEEAPIHLARALASSRPSPGRIVVREAGPDLLVGALRDEHADDGGAVSLSTSLDLLDGFRYRSWEGVVADCRRLAAQIRSLGLGPLDGPRGIPRGGRIVAGLLSYALAADLEAGAEPVLLVDDCAVSGYRLATALAGDDLRGRGVVVAHLWSAPDLRAAVRRRFPQVLACVAAHDLPDRTETRLAGASRVDWESTWRRRFADDERRLWVGIPAHVAFPWTEPDRCCWDEARRRVVSAFRVVPPERCLARAGSVDLSAADSLLPRGAGPLRPAEDVLWFDLGARLLVAPSAGPDFVELSGAAPAIWRALVEDGRRQAILDRLGQRWPATPSLGEETAALLDDLERAGLLVEDAR